MPRKKTPKLERPHRRSKEDLGSVSVQQPDEMLDVLKDMAEARERAEGVKIPIRKICDDAVAELLKDLRSGEKVFFAPTPRTGTTRKTVWLQPDTMTEMKEWVRRSNYHASTFVLTALLRYFAKHGITFENFPEV